MTFSQIDCNTTFTSVATATVTLVSQMAFQQKVYRVVLQFEFAKREMRRVNSHASHFFSGPPQQLGVVALLLFC